MTLARKLEAPGPPSLKILIARFASLEEYEGFVALIRDFLPEREAEILHQATPSAQMAVFASYFEDRYFPLDPSFTQGDVGDEYGALIAGIPVIVQGLSYDDYHEITSDWRSGYRLMSYLVQDPYEGDRVSLAEACKEYVPQGLLEQVPQAGFQPSELHRLLNDTPCRAVALWADILWHDTGNAFLDTDMEELWQDGLPEWDRTTVDNLTRDWQQAELVRRQVAELAEWLEEDPPAHFAEIVSLVLGE